MENGLPKGWKEIELKDAANINMGQSPPSSSYNSDGIGMPFFQGKAEFGKTHPTVKKYTDNPLKIAQPNDILISVRAPVGPTNIAKEECCIGRGLAAITANECTTNEYLIHFFKKIEFWLSSQGTGTTFNAISKKELSELIIPLPPLPEQHRIVAKLDALLARVDSARSRLDNLPDILQRFRQSVLAQAVSGKLTEEWRERNGDVESAEELFKRMIEKRKKDYSDLCTQALNKGERKPRKMFLEEIPNISNPIKSKLPDKWSVSNIDFLAYVTKLAGFEYTEYFKIKEEGEIPVVRAQNVQMGQFVDSNIIYIDTATSDFLERSQLHGREILMVFIGAGTGNVCLAPTNLRWHLAPNVAKIDPDFILPEYLCFYLQSSIGSSFTLSKMKATAQPSLSMGTIREIITIVPPLDEQKEIVRRVQSLLAVADRIEARYEALREKVEVLPQALLGKAFRGELV